VQNELELTPEQRQRGERINREGTQTRLDSLPQLHGLSPQQRRSRVLQWARNNERAMQETLSESQLKRLSQIALQLQGPGAFNESQVVGQLRLTDRQRAQIRQIEMEGIASMWDYLMGDTKDAAQENAAETPAQNDRNAPERPYDTEAAKTATSDPKRIRQDTMRQILDTLTPEQRNTWQTMVGNAVPDTASPPARIRLLPMIEGAGP